MSKTPTTPNIRSNSETNFTSHYALTRGQVNALLNELNTSSFISNIQLLFNTPIENICSLYSFPFDTKNIMPIASTTADNSIIVNVVTMQATGCYINPETVPLLDIGTYTIARKFNNFLDYAPYTKLEIYLPYIGFETLDTNIVMGQTINIKYAVDYMSGKCTAFILYGTGDEQTVILQRDGQIGVSVQIGGGAGAEVARNMLKFGVSAGAGAVALGAGLFTQSNTPGTVSRATNYGANTAINAVTSAQVHINKGGTPYPNTGIYAPQNAFIIRTTPIISRPASYDSTIGRPSGKTKQLDSLTGFTVVGNIHLENFQTATESEINEIENLLKTGVIL